MASVVRSGPPLDSWSGGPSACGPMADAAVESWVVASAWPGGLVAFVPVTQRGRGLGGSVRAAFRLLVWRPARVRAGGKRGHRIQGRGASLAARSPAGIVLAAIDTRSSKRRYQRLGLIYLFGFVLVAISFERVIQIRRTAPRRVAQTLVCR